MKTPQQLIESKLQEMAAEYDRVLKLNYSNGGAKSSIDKCNKEKQDDLNLISVVMDDYRKAAELLDKYGFLVKLVETKMSEL